MHIYEKLRSEKKQIRHWLHILMVLVTGGMWVPVYMVRAAILKAHNDKVDLKMQGALAAQSGARNV